MTKSNSHEQLIFPATERNREAILQALRPRLKLANRVLEVASALLRINLCVIGVMPTVTKNRGGIVKTTIKVNKGL